MFLFIPEAWSTPSHAVTWIRVTWPKKLRKTDAKVRTHNYLLTSLAIAAWGDTAWILWMTAFAICYSLAKCCPALHSSKHASSIQLPTTINRNGVSHSSIRAALFVNMALVCESNEQIMLTLVKNIYSDSSFPVYSELCNFVVKKKSLFAHSSWWNKLRSSMVIFLAILWNIISGTFQIDISLLKASVQSAFMDEETWSFQALWWSEDWIQENKLLCSLDKTYSWMRSVYWSTEQCSDFSECIKKESNLRAIISMQQ